jgi:hypothetical protein
MDASTRWPGQDRRDSVGINADQDRLARALEEVELLRVENARLRGLLGLDIRGGDGHLEAWVPTLFTQPKEATPVDATSQLAAKVGLLRSLFAS